MKCKKCNSSLLFLYFRYNMKDKRNWVKTKYLYCKNCKNLKQRWKNLKEDDKLCLYILLMIFSLFVFGVYTGKYSINKNYFDVLFMLISGVLSLYGCFGFVNKFKVLYVKRW